MDITQEFTVNKPIETVWALFQDIPAVAACLPGAELVEDMGNGKYAGTMEVRLGPMKTKFEGTALVAMNSATKTAHIEGEGSDHRGGSRGRVVVDYCLSGSEGGTTVTINANFSLSGTAAQFGRTSLVEEISSRIITEFTQCLESRLSSKTTAEAKNFVSSEIRAGSLLLRSLASWIGGLVRRLFRRQPPDQ